MRWTGAGIIAVVATVLLPLMTPAAHAQERKWCAEYGRGMGTENCGFDTFRQCQATVSGIGGFCERNPAYNDGEQSYRNRSRNRQYQDDR